MGCPGRCAQAGRSDCGCPRRLRPCPGPCQKRRRAPVPRRRAPASRAAARAKFDTEEGMTTMPHAEYSVTVSKPAQDVFDYLADGAHNREWRAGVLEIARTSEATGEGATY